ncbi:hypothetical protein RJ639_003303 [Escallonia herrerae]|uniref:Integrase catalytic domain-containing protein n=1 Tax=Escallonia herrerae TaxID=1293975 RepID=A0AA88W0D7_9ASTE|nr:hypothetical protein RJ639_003303 [Escallonia herrerae]
MPPCESYDGTGDPMEHLACFTSGMSLHLVPDRIMCRAFLVTLKGAAHVWFQHLAPRSISCWAQLAESFQSNFLTSRVQRKNSSALFCIVQGPKESLKSYYTRFNSDKLLIDHLDPGVTFAAMARGVRPSTHLRFSLNKRRPENMSDLLDRVEKYLRAEEDSTTSQHEETHIGHKRQDCLEGGNPNESKRSRATLPKTFTPLNTSRGCLCTSERNCLSHSHCWGSASTAEETLSIDDLRDEKALRRSEPIEALISIPLIEGDNERFLSKSAERCLPFFKALKNIKNFKWMAECQTSFNTLKEYLASPPLLFKSVMGEDLFLYLAVAESGVSAVLVREQDVEDVLYKRSFTFPYLRCLTPLEANYALREVHEGICEQHWGGRAVAYKVLRQGYYWLTMHRDALDYTRKCDACQRFSPIPRQSPSPLSSLSNPIPFVMWGMDIMGPFPRATAQRRFVIMVIDYFTKWIEAEALATISEKKCEDFFWNAIVCRFGISCVLVTENGKQFDNPTFRTFCANLTIEQHFTSVAHPQTNGQTEVTNLTLFQGIKKKLDGAKGLWIDELPKILWAYNMTTRTSTGETPFNLSFGTEALVPVEVGLPSLQLITHDPVQNEEDLRANLDLLDEHRE